MNQTAVILGDGQMALVMADALVTRGVRVRLWSPFEKDAAALQRTHHSPRLPEFDLSKSVEVTSDDSGAFNNATTIISAIPTQYLRQVWMRLREYIPDLVSIVSVTKGVENETLLRPTEVIADVLNLATAVDSKLDFNGQMTKSQDRQIPICALSGPSIASELARHLPASLVAASSERSCAECVQDLLRVPWLRIYRLDDVIGVEIAGAAKNVIALAAGMIDGLRAGDNAKSALLARGLAEIARLGVAMGAKLDTFFGIAGVGDLATTCFSPEGRNRTCGERIAKGETLQHIIESMKSVVEGVPTTKSVVALAKKYQVDMPITQAVHAILFEGLKPSEAIKGLMGRELKVEHVG